MTDEQTIEICKRVARRCNPQTQEEFRRRIKEEGVEGHASACVTWDSSGRMFMGMVWGNEDSLSF